MEGQEIKLNELVELTFNEADREAHEQRVGEIKRKLRHLYERKKTLYELINHHEKQISKVREGLKKVDEKIEQIKQGNWNVLNQVNTEEKLPQLPQDKSGEEQK